MNYKKQALITILVIFALMALVVISHATGECDHVNVTTETTVQEGDCYHYPETTVITTCQDCGLVTVEQSVEYGYVHGEIEIVDESTPATCVSEGWIVVRYVCKDCGQTVGGATQPCGMIAHPANADGTVDCYETRICEVAPNCDGYRFRDVVTVCTECNCVVSRTREQYSAADDAHCWLEWETSDDGNTRMRKCAACGKKEVQTDIFATDNTVEKFDFAKAITEYYKAMIELILVVFKTV